MSRKKFTDGWEGLFESASDNASGQTLLLFDLPESETAKSHRHAKSQTAESVAESHKHTGKSFASDLESFLQEAFEDSFAEQTQQRTDAEPEPDAKTRRRPAARGLDALIRNTMEEAHTGVEGSSAAVRRLVLFLDEHKIARLKSIARSEKTVLRSIVDQIVAQYIAEYERRHGE